jgi:hypothetical protein
LVPRVLIQKKKEMKKAERNCLYLKDGEEVHIGDILVKGDKLYVVDEEIIPVLIEQGVLCTKESLSEKKKDIDGITKDDLAFYINNAKSERIICYKEDMP